MAPFPQKYTVLGRMVEIAMVQTDEFKEFAMLDKVVPYIERRLAPEDPDKLNAKQTKENESSDMVKEMMQRIREKHDQLALANDLPQPSKLLNGPDSLKNVDSPGPDEKPEK